ncbi:MAG: hypothetical protein ACERKZ_16695 [Lachnotalea sp.]
MKKIFVDATEAVEETVALFIEGAECVLTGTTINSMSIKEKNDEYERFAQEYDINFIFDDEIPEIDFYTVPLIDIMATDSRGGYIGTIGEMTDFQSDAPICYISKERKCYILASNGIEFINGVTAWKKHMKPYENIVIYSSKEEATKEIAFMKSTNLGRTENIAN